MGEYLEIRLAVVGNDWKSGGAGGRLRGGSKAQELQRKGKKDCSRGHNKKTKRNRRRRKEPVPDSNH